MKIHYFQRYHQKENVETANTMLLLNRLYTYSPNKFYALLKKQFLPQNAEIEMEIELQKKSKNTIPDAVINQPSFKIVVETKLKGDFDIQQLMGHLDEFDNEKYKVVLTLDPKPMKESIKIEFQKQLREYNEINKTNISHCNTTFDEIVKSIESVIDERDFDMQDVLQDFSEYCYSEGLIPDEWKRMRVQLAGTTLEINKKLNIYYDNVDIKFAEHDYLGLYNKKSVRAIGKVIAIIISKYENGEWTYIVEKGSISDDIKKRINEAREDAKNYGYDMSNTRYFVVEKFYETDFQKETLYAPRGSRVFDLTELLDTQKLPEVKVIAEELKKITWK